MKFLPILFHFIISATLLFPLPVLADYGSLIDQIENEPEHCNLLVILEVKHRISHFFIRDVNCNITADQVRKKVGERVWKYITSIMVYSDK